MYDLDAAMHLKLVLNSVLAVAGSDVGHATAGLCVESGPAQDHKSVRGRGGSGIEAEGGPTQDHNSVGDGGGSVEHEIKDEPAQELKSVRDGGGLAQGRPIEASILVLNFAANADVTRASDPAGQT
jgi:hypothetical protein